MNLVSYPGYLFIRFTEHVGRLFILIGRLIIWLRLFPKNIRLISQQMLRMGVNSLPLVLFTSLFTGGLSISRVGADDLS